MEYNYQYQCYDQYQVEKLPFFSSQYSKIYNCKKRNTKSQIPICIKYAEVSQQIQKINSQLMYNITRQNRNLVQIEQIEYKNDGKQVIIVMEKCQENLEQQKTVYNEEQIIDFMKQYVLVYNNLFENQLAHGKINTNNIFINRFQGTSLYKLGDIFSQSNDTNIEYMAPEIFPNLSINEFQFNNVEKLDRVASDIYSLGMVLIKLIMGTLPFKNDRESIIQFFRDIQLKPYKIKDNILIDQELLNVIEKMIHFNPSDRISFNQICQNKRFKYQDRFSQTLKIKKLFTLQNYTKSNKFQTIQQPHIAYQFIQSQDEQCLKKMTNCFQNLSAAKLLPKQCSINEETQRFKAIKKQSTFEVIENYIQYQLSQNNLSTEIKNAYNQILVRNMNFVKEILDSYNDQSSEKQDQELIFIYCLVAYYQGYTEVNKKASSQYKKELLDV